MVVIFAVEGGLTQCQGPGAVVEDLLLRTAALRHLILLARVDYHHHVCSIAHMLQNLTCGGMTHITTRLQRNW